MKALNLYRDLVSASLRRNLLLMNGNEDADIVGDAETIAAGSELTARDPSPILVLEGWAAEQIILGDGRRQIFQFILPGDIVWSVQPKQHEISTMALTRMVCARLLLQADAATLARLARQGKKTIEMCLRNQVVRLGCLSGTERAAHLLLELYRRLERVGLAGKGRFKLPVGQEGLADALGLSTVHANRVIQKLRAESLLEVSRSEYVLPRLEALAERAGYVLHAQEDQGGAVPAVPLPTPPAVGEDSLAR